LPEVCREKRVFGERGVPFLFVPIIGDLVLRSEINRRRLHLRTHYSFSPVASLIKSGIYLIF